MALAAAGNIGYGLMFNCSLKGDPPGGSDKKESVSFMLGGFNTMLNFAAKGNIKRIYLTTGALSPFFGAYGILNAYNNFKTTDKSYGDYGKFGVQITSNILTSTKNGYCIIGGYALTILDSNGNFNQFYNYLDILDRNGGFVPLGNGYLYIPPRN